MFKFNFSSDSDKCSTEDDKEAAACLNVKWVNAIELDLAENINADNTIDSCCLREIGFAEHSVKLLKREIALTNIEKDANSPQYAIEAEENNSDLQSSKYEGGLKVWECCEDLGEYIISHLGSDSLSGKDILDLGCGAGLLGILALQLGARSVTFQDYNQEVLTHWTCTNVSLNFSVTESDIRSKCKFWSGDWGSFSSLCQDKFDFIFTSETIYNPDNYWKLDNIFHNQLKPAATVLLAAKSVYFSLGGSVQLFLSHINRESDHFECKQVFKSDEGVQRVIVEIKPVQPQTT